MFEKTNQQKAVVDTNVTDNNKLENHELWGEELTSEEMQVISGGVGVEAGLDVDIGASVL